MPPTSFKTGIIGGGLAGLCVAHTLLDDGVPAEDIQVVDSGNSIRGSNSPCGMLHAFPGRSLEPGQHTFEKLTHSLRLIGELDRQFGGIARALPMLRPVDDTDRGAEMRASWERARHSYPDWFDEEWVEASDVHRHHPGVSVGRGAIRYRPARSVRIDRLRRALTNKITDAGVTLSTNSVVEAVSRSDGRWRASISGGQDVIADSLVWAVGAGLDEWFDLPAGPRAGELLIVEPDPDAPELGAAVSGGGYVAPVPNASPSGARSWVAGATWFDPSEIEQRTNDLARAEIIEKTEGLVPAVANARISRVWRGVRFMLGHISGPLVGKIPGLDDAFVAGAFGSKGLLRIPWATTHLSARITHGDPVPESIRAGRIGSKWWEPIPTRFDSAEN